MWIINMLLLKCVFCIHFQTGTNLNLSVCVSIHDFIRPIHTILKINTFALVDVLIADLTALQWYGQYKSLIWLKRSLTSMATRCLSVPRAASTPLNTANQYCFFILKSAIAQRLVRQQHAHSSIFAYFID